MMDFRRFTDMSDFSNENPFTEEKIREAREAYENAKSLGVKRASEIAARYDDAVVIHWDGSPADAQFVVQINVLNEAQLVSLLDFAKSQEII